MKMKSPRWIETWPVSVVCIAALLAMIVFWSACVTSCASGGSPQGVGNVGGQGQQGVGLTNQNPSDSGYRSAQSGGNTDQSSRQTVNDPKPWIIGQSIFVLALALVGLYWIRHNSYLQQKPTWEKRKEYP